MVSYSENSNSRIFEVKIQNSAFSIDRNFGLIDRNDGENNLEVSG